MARDGVLLPSASAPYAAPRQAADNALAKKGTGAVRTPRSTADDGYGSMPEPPTQDPSRPAVLPEQATFLVSGSSGVDRSSLPPIPASLVARDAKVAATQLAALRLAGDPYPLEGVWKGSGLSVQSLDMSRGEVRDIYPVPMDMSRVTSDPNSIPLGKGPAFKETLAYFEGLNASAPLVESDVHHKGYTISGYRSEKKLQVAFDSQRPGTDKFINPLSLRTLYHHRGVVNGTQEVNWGVVVPGHEKRYFRTEAPQSPALFFEMLQHTGATSFVTLTNPEEENHSPRYGSRGVVYPRKNTGNVESRDGSPVGPNFHAVNLTSVDIEARTLLRHDFTEGSGKSREKPVKLVLKDGREVTCRIDLASHETAADVLAGRADVDLAFAKNIVVKHLVYHVQGTEPPEVVHRASHVEYTGWVDNGSMTAKQLYTLVEAVRAVDGKTNAGKNPLFVNCIFGHGRTGTLNMCLFLADLIDQKLATATSTEERVAMRAAVLDADAESGLTDATCQEINKLIGLYRGQTMAGAVACNPTCNQPLAVYQFFAEYFRAAVA